MGEIEPFDKPKRMGEAWFEEDDLGNPLRPFGIWLFPKEPEPLAIANEVAYSIGYLGDQARQNVQGFLNSELGKQAEENGFVMRKKIFSVGIVVMSFRKNYDTRSLELPSPLYAEVRR